MEREEKKEITPDIAENQMDSSENFGISELEVLNLIVYMIVEKIMNDENDKQ